MTMDRTLKTHGGLARARSVLTRAERIQQLTDEGKFDPETDSALGLPKVRKVAEEAPPEGTEAEGAEAPEETPEGKGAPKAKEAAEAKGPPGGKAAAKGKGGSRGKAEGGKK